MEPESDISDEFITITVNVKATTEFTIKTEQVEVQIYNDGRRVEDLVKYALEIEEDPTSLAKVTRQSDNAEIDLNTELSTFQDGTVLDISCKHILNDTDKIETMKHYTNPPSDYGSKKNKWRNLQLSFRKLPICDHREGRVGDDVTLYYQGFQRFIDNCHKIELSTKDSDIAKKVCDKMSKYFSEEKERENAFANVMEECFEVGDNDVVRSEQFQSVPDIAIDSNWCVIIEVKNESGQGGGSDSHSQAIAYYVKSLEKKKQDQCQAPAYLIELVGPQLTISGAVYGRYVFVDKLIDPVELVPQHNEEAIIKIARIFRALREAIVEIRQYYAGGGPRVTLPRFPAYQPFNEWDIQYVKAIKSHTYEGTLMQYGKTEPVNVIIKFVKRYSHEAHQFMHIKGHAPKLIFHAEGVNGTRYKAIVTEKIDFSHYGYQLSKEFVRGKFIEAVTTLYKGGFCHGNLLPKHIGYAEGTGRIYILNYEWATKQNDTKYPLLEHPTPGEEMELLNKLFQ